MAETEKMSEVFTAIYHNRKWRDTESVSGPGSNLRNTAELRRQLPNLLERYGVRSILDIPCGDFHWMSRINLEGISYIGADIVSELITEDQRKYAHPYRNFTMLDLTTSLLPKVDLVICRDCLGHLTFCQIKHGLANIKRSASGYLLATTFPDHPHNRDVGTGRWRTLNLEKPPLSLPQALEVIVEGYYEEGKDFGKEYDDKSVELWRISDLPDGGC